MNRSQVMRLALLGAVRKLLCEASGDAREAEADQWVARAHGAVSGCDAHSAYERVDEQNFFAYIFDTGEIFDPSYCATEDEDPQRGPLQRGFHEAFGVRKLPRIGEEMARRLSLNPISDFTTPAEFARITDDRTSSHRWFDKYLFAPMDKIRQRQHEPDAPVPESFTIPPPNAKRRIFFAFARAVPNLIDRLLEVAGGPSNTVIVSLQFDDVMNHELRHCQGKTAAELQQTMLKVHRSAYQLYTSILHVELGEPYMRAPPPSMPAATTLASAHAPSSGTGGPGAAAVETPEERLIARFQEMGLDSRKTGPGTCIALAHKILSKQWRKITARLPRGTEFLECELDEVVEVLDNGQLSKVGPLFRTVECLRAQVQDEHGRPIQGWVPQTHTVELAESDLIQLGIDMLDVGEISQAQAERALQLQREMQERALQMQSKMQEDRHRILASAAPPTSGVPEATVPEPQPPAPTRHLPHFLGEAEAEARRKAEPPSMPAATTLASAHAPSSGTGGPGAAVETPEERLIARFQEMGLDSRKTGPGTCIALAHKILSKQWRKITARLPRGTEFLECELDEVVEVLDNGQLSKVGPLFRTVECLRAQVQDEHGRPIQGWVPQTHTVELAESDLIQLGIDMLDVGEISQAQAERALQLQREMQERALQMQSKMQEDRHRILASAAPPTSGVPEATVPEPQPPAPTRHLPHFLDEAEALGIGADAALQMLESKGGDDQHGNNHRAALAELRSQLRPSSMAPTGARPPERGESFRYEYVYQIGRQDLGEKILMWEQGYHDATEGHTIVLTIPYDPILAHRKLSVTVWRDRGTLQLRKADVKVQGLSAHQHAAIDVSDYVHRT